MYRRWSSRPVVGASASLFYPLLGPRSGPGKRFRHRATRRRRDQRRQSESRRLNRVRPRSTSMPPSNELDARYLAGEAATTFAHVVGRRKRLFAALNRHELPTARADCVLIDHRRGHAPFEASDLTVHLLASWEVTPVIRIHVRVRALADRTLEPLMTLATSATSSEGFDAEWRDHRLLTRDDDLGRAARYSSETRSRCRAREVRRVESACSGELENDVTRVSESLSRLISKPATGPRSLSFIRRGRSPRTIAVMS